MKKLVRGAVQRVLTGLAKVWLKRKNPKIIGITGSCGKTSIKEALYAVLNTKFKVRKSLGNYNTEFGVPLTILGLKSGNSSPWLWFSILAQAFYKAFFDSSRVDVLILEMGVDKPFDMDDLLAVAKPDAAIFSNVKPVHLESGQFPDLDAIFNEKSKLITGLPPSGTAILNIDDVRVKKLVRGARCRVLTYSTLDSAASFSGRDISMSGNGLTFSVYNGMDRAAVTLPILGEYQVYVLLPAFACGVLFGMSLSEIAGALKGFELPNGRMSILAGINESILIDSSYNSSPDAAFEALKVLKQVGENAHRKIAVLGNMNELGAFTEREHRRIGRKASECCDILITVGEYAKYMRDEALANGFPEDRVFWFKDVFDAKEFLKDKIKIGDMILIKGSQNRVRLEILVKDLMRDKDRASELLVRQGKEWENF